MDASTGKVTPVNSKDRSGVITVSDINCTGSAQDAIDFTNMSQNASQKIINLSADAGNIKIVNVQIGVEVYNHAAAVTADTDTALDITNLSGGNFIVVALDSIRRAGGVSSLRNKAGLSCDQV